MPFSSPIPTIVVCLVAAALPAQCLNPWLPSAVFPDLDGNVSSSLVWDADGTGPAPARLVVGGSFGQLGSSSPAGIASYDLVNPVWSPLGFGVYDPPFSHGVFAMVAMPGGALAVGGLFQQAGLVGSVGNVAVWNGTAWSALGSGLNSAVAAMAVLPNGDLVAGGSFTIAGGVAASRIARWNGTAWSALGSGVSDTVRTLSVLPNGDLVAGGDFTTAGGVAASRIARWNGTSWSSLGSGLDARVESLLVLPNGDLLAGGQFLSAGSVPANHIARWDGSAWTAFGGMGIGSGATDSVRTMTLLPDGDLVVGGTLPAQGHVARWNGTAWLAIGVGVGGITGSHVQASTWLPSGQLWVGGYFQQAGGVGSPCLARLTTSCPAAATGWGSGCPSSGGANTLVATALPWVDATFRAQGIGLPLTAIVVAATSFTSIAQGALPLANVLAQAMPGCDLLVAPDILQLYATTTGSLESSFFLPNTPPIVGLDFFHQMVPIEVDALGNFVAISATNALRLTAGSF